MLFMAESLVYAILGAMAGYVLGQGTAKLIVYMNWLPGLNLNFSSVSAVFSTVLVMAVVLLSTLYPARKASRGGDARHRAHLAHAGADRRHLGDPAAVHGHRRAGDRPQRLPR